MEENLELAELFGQVYATRGLKQELMFLGSDLKEDSSEFRRVRESERDDSERARLAVEILKLVR